MSLALRKKNLNSWNFISNMSAFLIYKPMDHTSVYTNEMRGLRMGAGQQTSHMITPLGLGTSLTSLKTEFNCRADI